MSWIKKLVSLLFGDEEEKDTNDIEAHSLQEHQSVKNVLSDPPSSMENHHQIKAEARVSYQYPKGNFRFPIIPDERHVKREERPRRPSGYQENTHRKQREQKNNAYKKQKPYTEVRIDDKKETSYTNKKPFHPTAIPSPVFGFQARDERMQYRPYHLVGNSRKLETINGERVIGDKRIALSKAGNEYKTNKIVERVHREEKQNPIHMHDQLASVEEVDDTLLTFENGKKELNENNKIQQKEDDLVDEALYIVKTEYQKQNHESKQDINEKSEYKDPIGHQFEEDELELEESIQKDEDELELEESIQKDEDELELEESIQKDEVVLELEESIQKDEDELELEESIQEDEVVLELEESIQEDEVVLELEESIQGEEQLNSIQPQEKDLPSDVDRLTSKKQEEAEYKENQPQDISSQDQNKPRRKTVPFNVMMLGRDKQKLREKAQDHSYQFPSLAYLNIPEKELTEDHTWLESQKDLLNVTLLNFNVRASVVNVTQGPSVTRFEVHPEPGVKVNKITNLSDDIKLSLSARDIRIEAPIPGKNTIGIEVPNKVSKMVYLREILRSNEFRSNPSPMTAVLGLDIAGQPAVTDLKKMPHGLIAGATGSGKSVCINTILVSLLYKASPHEVKLMLIDPKMVELAPYNDIPHLVSPVITDVKAATAALKWAVEEMERRYELFAHSGTREITRYNQLVKEHKQGEHLPYLVIVIDELADLMMVAPNDVEEAICRIAQKARACGIHLIVATQRPSVDVITGLIKANIPTRIAFSVSSQVDSRTIIDVNGAEKLLGKGDMLFLENGSSKAVRLQGTFVSDEEIERVVKHVKLQSKPEYLFHQDELVKKATIQSDEDELFLEACEFVVNQGGASTSSLQRRFRIGYNRAARLIDMMEEQGIISENRGSKPRDVLISEEELDAIQETHIL